MDPVTIVGLVEGSISLAVQCGSAAKSLNTLVGQYKYAKLTISTMVQNLDIMQIAWDRIGTWSKNFLPTDDDAFTQRLERFLETGSLVLDALEDDLRSYDASNLSFTQRSRLAWNEDILQGHQNRIRDQAQSMSLLLQAIQLPTLDATNILLQQSKKQFMKSDESALSIVPSRLSSRLSLDTSLSGRRDSIGSRASMAYRRLSFEDDLFTAIVYKRNYRALRSQDIWKMGPDLSRRNTTPQEPRCQIHERLAKLRLHRASDGRNTTVISSPKAKTTSEEGTEYPLSTIRVSTSYSISFESIDQNLQNRIGPSSFGVDGLFVKLGDTLEQRISSSASASYKKLVLACSSDWSPGVEVQFAMISTPEESQVPGLLGSYISGSLYFCPVHAAVFRGNLEGMQALLRRAELEGDLERVLEKAIGGTESDPWRPLHVAALKGNLPMVRLLLEKGASVCSETGILRMQAIHLAARNGSRDMLATLLDAGADASCADRDGLEPLHYASESRDQPVVIQYLRQRVASINRLRKVTVLYLAYMNDFPGNIAVLRELIIDTGVPFIKQWDSALVTAIQHHSAFHVELILRTGVDPTLGRSDGGTGLHTFVQGYNKTTSAYTSADTKILKLLLLYTDLHIRDHDGHTVLESLFVHGRINHDDVGVELAKLFQDNLPEDEFWEREKLRLWCTGK